MEVYILIYEYEGIIVAVFDSRAKAQKAIDNCNLKKYPYRNWFTINAYRVQ